MDPQRRPEWSPIFNAECAVAAHSRPTLELMNVSPFTSRIPFIGNAGVRVATGIVFAGAAFFGVASCGGREWHGDLFRVVATVAVIGAVVLPSRLLSSISRKVAFVLGIAVGFQIVQAATAPFYPATPESLQGYITVFLQSLEFGPCG